MRAACLLSLLSLGSAVLAAPTPFSFPLSNGFPNINNPSAQLSAIELQAHGTLPTSPLPAKIAAADLDSFKLIAFNELFEVAYFSAVLSNLTNNATGFWIADDGDRARVTTSIAAIVAQEELHALLAQTVLKTHGVAPIQPCQYSFSATNLESAILFAATFTDAVVGTLGAAAEGMGQNGDYPLIPGITSVIGQESQQVGFFRSVLSNIYSVIASELPFLTPSTPEFAFSFLNQNVIVPGSCPNINTIPLPIFKTLKLTSPAGQVPPKTQTFTFVVQGSVSECSGYYLAIINQQNIPVVESISNITDIGGGYVQFNAAFPYDQYLLNGLSIYALVKSKGPFSTAADVAAATVYGPALTYVN